MPLARFLVLSNIDIETSTYLNCQPLLLITFELVFGRPLLDIFKSAVVYVKILNNNCL